MFEIAIGQLGRIFGQYLQRENIDEFDDNGKRIFQSSKQLKKERRVNKVLEEFVK